MDRSATGAFPKEPRRENGISREQTAEGDDMQRIAEKLKGKIMTAEDAARLIRRGDCLGCSGFSMVGYPVAVPNALALLPGVDELSVLTGASVGDSLDGALARAGKLRYRAPYQSGKDLRRAVNAGIVRYNDFHLSCLPAALNSGSGPKIDFAVIECPAVTEEGILPGFSLGASESFIARAEKIILEINHAVPAGIYGMHDICSCHGEPLNIRAVTDRIGSKLIPYKPEKIAAIVETNKIDSYPVYKKPDLISESIADNIVRFLKSEVAAGRQPANLRPIQSGVGNVANAVLSGLGSSFSNLKMYTEVMQDSAFDLVKKGIITGASTTSLSLSADAHKELFSGLEEYRQRIVIRPQEISNNPEVIRRLQVIAMNTPIEVDIYGNVNSSHVMGTQIMNGIGGSGDFARSAGLTIFSTGSLAKDGKISCIVPMVSHVDHTEHDVDIIVTEWGVADLRWKTPRERAELIIDNCAHPDYRDMLWDYFCRACAQGGGQTPHLLSEALSWHDRYLTTGTMKM